MKLKDIYSLRFWFVRVWYRSIAAMKALRALIKGVEYITGVAIIVDGKTYALPRPYRHHHCVHKRYLETHKQVATESQGFITSHLRYVDRKEGLQIARDAGQLLSRHFHKTELFSESMW